LLQPRDLVIEHPCGIGGKPKPAGAKLGPYWPGWDISRGITMVDNTGGFIVDGWGGIHGFDTSQATVPAGPANGPYWPGWTIVRGIASV
jgi:hypothetical protein